MRSIGNSPAKHHTCARCGSDRVVRVRFVISFSAALWYLIAALAAWQTPVFIRRVGNLRAAPVCYVIWIAFIASCLLLATFELWRDIGHWWYESDLRCRECGHRMQRRGDGSVIGEDAF